jgi:hypothetical protein
MQGQGKRIFIKKILAVTWEVFFNLYNLTLPMPTRVIRKSYLNLRLTTQRVNPLSL